MDFHDLGNLVEGEAVYLAAGSLLHQADSLFDIRGVVVGSSEIYVAPPGHPFNYWFKWHKFAIRMDCYDPKSMADVESAHLFEILEDLFLGTAR